MKMGVRAVLRFVFFAELARVVVLLFRSAPAVDFLARALHLLFVPRLLCLVLRPMAAGRPVSRRRPNRPDLTWTRLQQGKADELINYISGLVGARPEDIAPCGSNHGGRTPAS